MEAWEAACAELSRISEGETRAALERLFTPYAVSFGGNDTGLITGYYEPELRGSSAPDERYRFPLYRRPGDIVVADLGAFDTDLSGRRLIGRVEEGRFVPYHERTEIENGALAGGGLELLWVDSAVDLFFLQIQGSGRVRLEDGSVVRVGYAGKNGRPYVAIGRVLIERGELNREAVSMQSIRAWLGAHPDQAADVMSANPSYVFFRIVDGEGPIGAQGVPLTAGRSIAVDPAFVPLGAPVWLETTDPLDPGTPLHRLVVAQDTGGAIKGAVRGDLFFGAGSEASERAGRMTQEGRLFVHLPKGIDPAPSS